MSITYVGATLSVVASTPATEDASAYGGLSYDEVGKVVSIGEMGDESEDVTWNLLKAGRTTRANGTKDLGEIPVTIEYDSSDTGQGIIETANNTNTTHTFKVTDPDGEIAYFQGLIANLKDLERTPNQYKGKTFVIRGQTGITPG